MIRSIWCKLGMHKWAYKYSGRICNKCSRKEKFMYMFGTGETYYE